MLASLDTLDSNTPFMTKREHAAVGASTELTKAVGLGPFRFVADQYEPSKKAVCVRNAAYVPRDEPPSGTAGGKAAKVDRVEWRYYRKPNDARKVVLFGSGVLPWGAASGFPVGAGLGAVGRFLRSSFALGRTGLPILPSG